MKKQFHRGAEWCGNALGSPHAMAATLLLLWLCFAFYRLGAVNVGISVFSLLVLVVIQATQNRNDRAIHLKLDAIIASLERADNRFIKAETRDDEQIDELIQAVEEQRYEPE